MANELNITEARLGEIGGILQSTAPADVAQVPGIASELLADYKRALLRLASQAAHIQTQNNIIASREEEEKEE